MRSPYYLDDTEAGADWTPLRRPSPWIDALCWIAGIALLTVPFWITKVWFR